MPRSTDHALYHRLAQVSGESVRTLRRLGFQLAPSVGDEGLEPDDESPFDRAPLYLDWDALEDQFGVARRALSRAS